MDSCIADALLVLFGLMGIVVVCVGSWKIFKWFIGVNAILQKHSTMESKYMTLKENISIYDEEIAYLREQLEYKEDALSRATEKLMKQKERTKARITSLLENLRKEESRIVLMEKEINSDLINIQSLQHEISVLRNVHLALEEELANVKESHRVLEEVHLDQAIAHQRTPSLDIIERFLCKDYNSPEFAEFSRQYEETKSRKKEEEATSGIKQKTPRGKNATSLDFNFATVVFTNFLKQKYGPNSWICSSAASVIFGDKPGLHDLIVVLRYEANQFKENPRVPAKWKKLETFEASTYRTHYQKFRGVGRDGHTLILRDVEESTLGDELRDLATKFITTK